MAISNRTLILLRIALYCLIGILALAAAYLLWTALQLRQPLLTVDFEDISELSHSALEHIETLEPTSPASTPDIMAGFTDFAAQVDALGNHLSGSALVEDAEFIMSFEQLQTYVQETRPLMADAASLTPALPALHIQAETMHGAVDALLHAGLETQSASQISRRLALSRVIALLACIVLATLALIVVVSWILRQQTRAIRLASRANSQANERLTATINASLDAVIVADMHGIILDYNGSASQIFGYRKEEVIGLNLSEIIIPPHLRTAHKEGMKRYRETENPKLVDTGQPVAISAIRKDGSEFPVELLLARGESRDGPIMISYIRDMTEAKAAEAALQEARDAALAADKAKSRFLAIMSHEMRTPLTGMFGALDLLEETKLNANQQRTLDLAQTSAQTLLRHVTDVLDISRIDSGQLNLASEPLSLPALLDELRDANAPLAEVEDNKVLCLHEGLANPVVAGDAHRLRQILLNLMTNAFKFTKDGLITLRIQEVEALQGKSRYIFTVEDTGAGIQLENQPHIFEEFYTQDQTYSRRRDGTGLGLAIVKRLVELMGGTIDFSSAPGKGSRFWFTLILPHAELSERPTQRGTVNTAARRGNTILLVEDNETSRLVISALLRKRGFEVLEAENGAEAVTRAYETPLDLILMDISMPVMDGLEATEKIRAGDGPNQQTPILALTAHAMKAEQEAFLAAGMAECLTKPVDAANLVAVLDTYLLPTTAHNPVISDLRSTLGEDLFAKTIQTFLSETHAAFGEMQSHVAAGHLGEVQAMAHKTLGAAGMLGAHELQDAPRAVEQAGKADLGAAIPDLLADAEKTWQRTQAEMRALIETV